MLQHRERSPWLNRVAVIPGGQKRTPATGGAQLLPTGTLVWCCQQRDRRAKRWECTGGSWRCPTPVPPRRISGSTCSPHSHPQDVTPPRGAGQHQVPAPHPPAQPCRSPVPGAALFLTLFPAKRRGRGVAVSGKSLSRRGSRFSCMPWHEVTVSRSTRSLSREWHSSSRW